jgi:hypothetical protein
VVRKLKRFRKASVCDHAQSWKSLGATEAVNRFYRGKHVRISGRYDADVVSLLYGHTYDIDGQLNVDALLARPLAGQVLERSWANDDAAVSPQLRLTIVRAGAPCVAVRGRSTQVDPSL